MRKRGLAALYQALASADSAHLDDEMLARIADATMAGEDIETGFDAQLAHLEHCERCATEFNELMGLLEAALGDLDQAAQAIPLVEIPAPDSASGAVSTPWRQALETIIEEIGAGIRLTFAPSPAAQIREIPPLYGYEADWLLSQIDLPAPIRAGFTAVLNRQTPETCRLTITLRNKAGPSQTIYISLAYFQNIKSSVIPPAGTVHFDDIPISAVPTLTITLTPQN